MSTIADIYLEYFGDLQIDQNGGIALSTGWDFARQAFERLLLTNFSTTQPDGSLTPPDYIFHPLYGLGLRATIGQNANDQLTTTINNKVKAAAAANPAVAANPSPLISVIVTQHVLQIFIDLWMSDLTPGTIALEITN